jgi:hypothetical protein
VYAVVLVFGYLAGAHGLTEFRDSADASKTTPSARVGYVLAAPDVEASAEAWSRLAEDLRPVQAALAPHQQGVFDLVVALRGLDNGGKSNFVEAERVCRSLGWPRCDQPALEELERRSRP